MNPYPFLINLKLWKIEPPTPSLVFTPMGRHDERVRSPHKDAEVDGGDAGKLLQWWGLAASASLCVRRSLWPCMTSELLRKAWVYPSGALYAYRFASITTRIRTQCFFLFLFCCWYLKMSGAPAHAEAVKRNILHITRVMCTCVLLIPTYEYDPRCNQRSNIALLYTPCMWLTRE